MIYTILYIVTAVGTIIFSSFVASMFNIQISWMEKNKLTQTDKVLESYNQFKAFKGFVMLFIFVIMPVFIIGSYTQYGSLVGNKVLIMYCLSFLILGITILYKSKQVAKI